MDTTRITVKVPDDLHKAVRIHGIMTDQRLDEMVIAALRRMLAEAAASPPSTSEGA
jgi:hypothetical protein